MHQPTDSPNPAITPPGSRITDQNLLALHQAYQDFMNTRPWKELNDRNILVFNTRKPDTQACCAVMGHWGIEYGLAGYTGPLAIEAMTELALRDDGDGPRTARSIAATTGHKSLVSSDERRRMHRMGLKYQGNENYPVWFAIDPGEQWTRNIDDQEASMLAEWLRAAVDIAVQARAGALDIITMSLGASDGHTFHPIECVKLTDSSWKHTPTTMSRRR